MDSASALQANPPLKLQSDRGAGSVFVPEQGGYKEKFVKAVEDKYKCEKCRLVLCSPKQTECGHRFCETCMAALLRWVLVQDVPGPQTWPGVLSLASEAQCPCLLLCSAQAEDKSLSRVSLCWAATAP